MHEEDLKQARILIVDDEPANVRLMERLLSRAGYTTLRSATDSRRALALFAEFQPDLVLLDLLMPERDGFQIMEDLRPLVPEGSYLPILALTADITAETRRRALATGAKDFLTKPFDAIEVLLRIQNLLETRRLYVELETRRDRLEEEVRDRTERLLQSEKIATMGELLGGVAHELNNPLAVITGYAGILLKTVTGPDAQRVEKIARAANRCVRIVKNFLAMARQRAPERQRVSLNEVVRDSVELLGYPLRVDNVEVTLDLAEDLPILWADPHQLQQVVINLISNAHHALRSTASARGLALCTRRDPGLGRVVLEVADTGPGIPPEIRKRIFDAFFTTKPVGQGTGLGLSLCQGIVDSHGGAIRAESRPGEGAVFTVELPVQAPPVVELEAGEVEMAAVTDGKAILVVDDEPDIAGVVADILSADGHHVGTASNGLRAIEKLSERAWDLILTDLRMPELDGPGFYREIERREPGLLRSIVFITGDTLQPDTSEFLERTAAPSIAKPFDPDQLRRVVRQALARREGQGPTDRPASA